MTETEHNAAAQAAGRELISSALLRNPVIALATVVVGPLVGLFRRRGALLREVQRIRLESYRSRPVPPPVLALPRTSSERTAKEHRIRLRVVRTCVRRPHSGAARRAVQLQPGGPCHG